ncbi:MAG TPA: hypothetical protein VGK54_10885, partial [Chloroflexota bacterium]
MIKRFYWMTGAFMGWALLGRPAFGQTAERSARLQDSSAHHLNVKSSEMKWQKIFPDLGARSAEITILRVDPTTQATHLMIRVPKNFH